METKTELKDETSKMVYFEDVKNQTSEEYFEGNQFSIDAFNKKYAKDNKETIVQGMKRVCDFIASVEPTQELRKYWSERWFDEMYNGWWMPAGSIMQGAGSGRNISLANCTHISLGSLRTEEQWDNLESILKNTAYTVAKCAAYRQGLGVDFSRLRPSGTNVMNSANQSNGAVHWMKYIDNIGYAVGQKGRIPAMLFSLNIHHPDVQEFITVKSDYTKVQNANISVQITDDFYEAVKNDDEWELKFVIPEIKKGEKIYLDEHSIDMLSTKEKETGRYYKVASNNRKEEVFIQKVNARKLLELIAKNMHANAEPGIQNIDLARKYSNSDAVYDPNDEYDSRIIGTNACSEQYLSRESLCVLASIDCGRFSTDVSVYYLQLQKIATSVNRFLDNVNECELVYNTFATPHQELAIRKLRRTGAGLTNIAAWLFKKGLVYGESDGNDAVEDFAKWYNYWLYVASEKLGKEKGNFGLFNKEKWKNAPFISRLIEESKKLNQEFGVPLYTGNHARNVTCSSIAPTGCIEENTRIRTSKGLIKIKELVPSTLHPEEKKFTHNISDIHVDNENGFSKVVSFYNNGKVNGYVITLEDGRKIKTSETHRIRILKNGNYSWEYAPNLKSGDIVVSSKETSLGVTDYVKLNVEEVSNHFNTSPCKLPLELNEDLAEFIGMFNGDGSLKFRSENGKIDGIRFPVFGDDVDLELYISNMVKNLFGLECKREKQSDKNMIGLDIHSMNLGNFLIKNGFSKKDFKTNIGDSKSHVYSVPELIFRSPKSVISSYLRGLFETDGTVSNGNIVFYSKFKHVTEEVQELLSYLGIQSYLSENDRSEDTSAFNDKMYRLTIGFKSDNIKFKSLIGFISNRKKLELENSTYQIDREKIYFSESKLRELRNRLSEKVGSKCNLYSRLNSCIFNNTQDGMCFVNRDTLKEISLYVDLGLEFSLESYSTVKIKDISRETFNTFDIEVEDDSHTYITANGIVNHNTLSLMFQKFILSYGIEPAFFVYFWKRTRMAGKYEYYFCVPRVVREMFKEKGLEIPIKSDTLKDDWDGSKGKPIAEFIDKHKHLFNFKESTQISPMDKLDLMSKVMKWVDSSISVTYMLPIGSTWKDVYDFILKAHEKEVKSIAAFPDKKMYGIVSSISFKDLAFKLKSEGVGIHPQNFTDDELKVLNLSRENIIPTSGSAPERLSTLEADINVVTVKGQKFAIVVGLQNGVPYEIFGGHLNGLGLKSNYKRGKITRIKKSQYSLEFDDITIEDFSKQFTPTEQILFRMASMSLKHGVPIVYIVEQLQKATDDITSMASAAARVLKKYIKDGTAAQGQKCPSCESHELIYIDGCVSCSKCSWSKCS